MENILSFSQWQKLVRPIVLFCIHPKCDACIDYKPTMEQIVDYGSVQRRTPNVTYAQLNLENITSDPLLQKLTQELEVRTIPCILFVTETNHVKLEHRTFSAMENWLQKRFYPEKTVTSMLATEAIYEIRNLSGNKSLSKRKKEILTILLTRHNDPALDKATLLSWTTNPQHSNLSRDELVKNIYHSIVR